MRFLFLDLKNAKLRFWTGHFCQCYFFWFFRFLELVAKLKIGILTKKLSLFFSGTKLRCPFCERTYGYETNLRAHIRQRHQGIRVSCPYCPRTFTRNNTVRRHVAREHRHIGGRLPTKFGSTRVMPDPIRIGQVAAAASLAQEADRIQRAAGLQATTSPRAEALNDNIAAVGNNGGPSPPPSGQPGPNITASSSVSQNTTAP